MLTEEQISYVCPPTFHVEWFRHRHPVIKISDPSSVEFISQAMNDLQGTKHAGKVWIDRLNCALDSLRIKRCASDYGVCICYYDGNIIILNLSTDDILVATSNAKSRKAANDALSVYFQFAPNIYYTESTYLN